MLQTWDAASGRPMVKLGDRMFKLMGTASIGWSYTGGAQSGTITDSRFTQYPGSIPRAFVINAAFDRYGGAPSITISGNTLTWTYPNASATQTNRPNNQFMYGFY